MAITAPSPWGAIFTTPLSANSILGSPSFLPQVPDRAGLSPFLSPAVAVGPARANRPQASTTVYLRALGTMTFDPPSRETAAVRQPAAAEPAASPMTARAEARAIN